MLAMSAVMCLSSWQAAMLAATPVSLLVVMARLSWHKAVK
jgi:hypothetical protein